MKKEVKIIMRIIVKIKINVHNHNLFYHFCHPYFQSLEENKTNHTKKKSGVRIWVLNHRLNYYTNKSNNLNSCSNMAYHEILLIEINDWLAF